MAGFGGTFGLDFHAWSPDSWEALGTWATAVIALLALVAALIANSRTRGLLSLEVERRAGERADEQQEQGRLISVWVPSGTSSGHQTLTNPFGLVLPDLVLSNRSTSPVFDVVVLVWTPEGAYKWLAAPTLPPREGSQVVSRYLDQPDFLASILEHCTGVSVFFTDTRKQRWYKTRRGELISADSLHDELSMAAKCHDLGTLPQYVRSIILGYPADRDEAWREAIRRQRRAHYEARPDEEASGSSWMERMEPDTPPRGWSPEPEW
jgi:hypothetical protein